MTVRSTELSDVSGPAAPADLVEVRDELRTVARDLLAATSPLVTGGEPGAPDWALLARSGWLGLEVPESLGGAGASFAEVAVVVEELGRVASTAPYLGGVVLAVGALLLAEPSDERDGLLGAIAEGQVRVAVALPTAGAGPLVPPFEVARRGTDVVVDGGVSFVPEVVGAERVLVVGLDPDRGPVVVALGVDDGLRVAGDPLVDASRSVGDVMAERVVVDRARSLAIVGDLDTLLHRGATAVALDALGASSAALDATVAYVADRHQFGRPVGSFQSVKHGCADSSVELALSQQLARDAVARLATDDPGTEVAAARAKAHASEVAVRIVGRAVQHHGGIGYTWEHGLHVLLKRVTLDRSLFGGPVAHRARLARLLAGQASPG